LHDAREVIGTPGNEHTRARGTASPASRVGGHGRGLRRHRDQYGRGRNHDADHHRSDRRPAVDAGRARRRLPLRQPRSGPTSGPEEVHALFVAASRFALLMQLDADARDRVVVGVVLDGLRTTESP
jgi:hypothetical protein